MNNKPVYIVAAYEVNQAYGGPEEELARGRLEEDTPKWILETIDYAIAKAQGKETK